MFYRLSAIIALEYQLPSRKHTYILQIVSSFSYLGVVFTAGGSFSNAQNTLSDKAQKAIFKLNSYLYDFVTITTKHILELFDKLVSPILNYGA